jgi:lipoyl(octanoyl) transferase
MTAQGYRQDIDEAGNRPLQVIWLGRRDYREAWELQRELAARRLAGEAPDTLLLLEHPPTLTLGRAAQREHIIASPQRLERLGVAVVETDRGGDVTYHGPGQLVGYPILNLNQPPHPPNLHAYLRRIEEGLIQALALYGIRADRFPGYTGVWVNRREEGRVEQSIQNPESRIQNPIAQQSPAKIAAIGVKASRWITTHGFALNVCPDLSHFDLIVPCGIHEYGVTSMTRQLGREISVEELLSPVAAAFASVFGYPPPPLQKDLPPAHA